MINLIKRLSTSLVLFILLYIALINNLFLFTILFIVNFILLIELNQILNKIFIRSKKLNFFIHIIVLIYSIFFSLSIWLFLSFDENINKLYFLLILGVCITTDVGGYFFGKTFGGPKLTSISPNKTYAGMIGSFVFSTFFVFSFIIIFDYNYIYIFYAIIISAISQMGDLFISYLKRKAKIKDSGSILPGHGGLLDRMDGILFAVPIGLTLISL